MNNTSTDIDTIAREARELLKKATRGPWFQWTTGGDISSEPEDAMIMKTLLTEPDQEMPDVMIATAQGNADREFVVFARNHLAAILDDRDRLKDAIREVHSQHADDLCWMPSDVNKIFEAAGLPQQNLRVGDKSAMLRNCERYVGVLCDGGPWKSYMELEAENARLKGEVERLKEEAKTDDTAIKMGNRLLQIINEDNKKKAAYIREINAELARLLADVRELAELKSKGKEV